AIQASSVLVSAKSGSQSLMTAPRMANVIAVATSATQLAMNRRRWFMVDLTARYYYSRERAKVRRYEVVRGSRRRDAPVLGMQQREGGRTPAARRAAPGAAAAAGAAGPPRRHRAQLPRSAAGRRGQPGHRRCGLVAG